MAMELNAHVFGHARSAVLPNDPMYTSMCMPLVSVRPCTPAAKQIQQIYKQNS